MIVQDGLATNQIESV